MDADIARMVQQLRNDGNDEAADLICDLQHDCEVQALACIDLMEQVNALTAEVEALRRDAERVAFLDTVSVAIHARNGRRYEAGPGNARDIIDMAQRYHAARHQEATNGR